MFQVASAINCINNVKVNKNNGIIASYIKQ